MFVVVVVIIVVVVVAMLIVVVIVIMVVVVVAIVVVFVVVATAIFCWCFLFVVVGMFAMLLSRQKEGNRNIKGGQQVEQFPGTIKGSTNTFSNVKTMVFLFFVFEVCVYVSSKALYK